MTITPAVGVILGVLGACGYFTHVAMLAQSHGPVIPSGIGIVCSIALVLVGLGAFVTL